MVWLSLMKPCVVVFLVHVCVAFVCFRPSSILKLPSLQKSCGAPLDAQHRVKALGGGTAVRLTTLHASSTPISTSSAEAIFRNMLLGFDGTFNGSTFEYHGTNAVVDEKLKYVDRPVENKRIVECFQIRQRDRAKASSPGDKNNNQLVAIPGSPGVGKSTFLVHFPLSQEYKQYCGESNPIVCPLSFNSEMTKATHFAVDIGLRILYGAAVSMGALDKLQVTWGDFLAAFKYVECPTAEEAVVILRNVFGVDRRVLILVDELAKFKTVDDQKKVMSQLGEVLDTYSYCDVVVSALSPQFVQDLASGSQRRIEYCVLPMMLATDEIKQACAAWAMSLRKEYPKISNFTHRMLSSVYLFASGHLRTLEYLKESCESTSSWPALKSHLNKVKASTIEPSLNVRMLMAIAKDFSTINKYGASLESYKEVFPFIFSNEAFHPREHPKLRAFTENGTINLIPSASSGLFKVQIPLSSLFFIAQSLASDDSQDQLVQNVKASLGSTTAFDENADTTTVSDLWERFVACSFVTGNFKGVTPFENFNFRKVIFRQATKNDYGKLKPTVPVVAFAPPHEAGSDGLMEAPADPRSFHLQMKMCESSKDDFQKNVTIASSIKNIIKKYPHKNLNHLYVVFAAWWKEDPHLRSDKFIESVTKQINDSRINDTWVRDHVTIFDSVQLKELLPPSFIAMAELFQAVNGTTSESKSR